MPHKPTLLAKEIHESGKSILITVPEKEIDDSSSFTISIYEGKKEVIEVTELFWTAGIAKKLIESVDWYELRGSAFKSED